MTEPIDTPPAPPPTEIVPISAPSMKPVSGSVMLRVLLVAVFGVVGLRLIKLTPQDAWRRLRRKS